MTCLVCGTAMKTRRENYRYTASGLPHVVLVGVQVSRCPKCGETSVAIPQIEDLHRAIAKAVIRKRAALAPVEIRFLRKYLGWSGADFARHLGATPETVSRWEHGKTPMGGMADRLLRLMIMTRDPASDYGLEQLAGIQEKSAKPVALRLRTNDEGWHAEAA